MTTRLSAAIAVPARRAERQDLRYWGLGLVGIALLAVLSFIYLAQTSAVSTLGYDIKALESEQKLWQAKNDQLRLQIAELRSLNRVEKEAAAKLGMSQPSAVVYVQATPTTPAPRAMVASARTSDRGANAVTTASLASSTSSDQNWMQKLAQLLPFGQRPATDTSPN